MKRNTALRLACGLALAVLAPLTACSTPPPPPPLPSAVQEYTIVNTYPHDRGNYTQGLEVVSPGVLLESTGLEGKSKILTVAVASQKVLKSTRLPEEVFGEGATKVGDEFLQITWRNEVGYRYNSNLEKTSTFTYKGEGWGLCYQASSKTLYRSDGTNTIHKHAPDDFTETGSISVTYQGKAIRNLNELECVGDFLWANVWRTNQVVKISATTGEVVKVYDFTSLVEEAEKLQGEAFSNEQVLNGIAYDEIEDVWYLTGKQWATLFKVRLK